MVLLLKNSQNLQFWVFLEKGCFFEKEPWVASKTLIVTKVFENGFQMIMLLKNFQCVQNLGFFEKKRWVFQKNLWNIAKSLSVANFFKNASQMIFVLKKAQNVQKLGFFSEKMFLFPKNNLEMFQDRWLWQYFLESVSNGIIA